MGSRKGRQKAVKQVQAPKVRLDPRVREAAIKLAGGDAARVQAIHRTEAIVLNRPQPDDEVIRYD